MEHYNITLTTEDRRILNSYCTVATGMAEFWGENCEIIIHNLERLDASVMMIVNGYHSGRQAGAPISELDPLLFESDVGRSYFTPHQLFCQKQTGRNIQSVHFCHSGGKQSHHRSVLH